MENRDNAQLIEELSKLTGASQDLITELLITSGISFIVNFFNASEFVDLMRFRIAIENEAQQNILNLCGLIAAAHARGKGKEVETTQAQKIISGLPIICKEYAEHQKRREALDKNLTEEQKQALAGWYKMNQDLAEAGVKEYGQALPQEENTADNNNTK